MPAWTAVLAAIPAPTALSAPLSNLTYARQSDRPDGRSLFLPVRHTLKSGWFWKNSPQYADFCCVCAGTIKCKENSPWLWSGVHSRGLFLVRAWGLEPQRIAAREPKSRMSTNSIMPANMSCAAASAVFHGYRRYCNTFSAGAQGMFSRRQYRHAVRHTTRPRAPFSRAAPPPSSTCPVQRKINCVC